MKRYLSGKGFDVIITSRRYNAIEGLVRALGVETVLVGGYGESIYEKLREDINRMARLLEILSPRIDNIVAGISYPNPAEARITYGLGKPLIILSDTPHSVHVHRLAVPLASYLVYSDCIEDHEWRPYLLPHTRAVKYHGVDELSWIFYLEDAHNIKYVKSLGLEEKSYIVVRPEESKASYYRWGSRGEMWFKLIDEVFSMGLKVVFLPRYEDQRRAAEEKYRNTINREKLIIPPLDKAIGPALAKNALAVITGGGTMAREAALYGVPGITFFPLELSVDKCLASKGAPIYRVENLEDALKIIRETIKNPEIYKEKARKAIQGMKPPHETIYSLIQQQIISQTEAN
jgi:predicted glycosyltransferase